MSEEGSWCDMIMIINVEVEYMTVVSETERDESVMEHTQKRRV